MAKFRFTPNNILAFTGVNVQKYNFPEPETDQPLDTVSLLGTPIFDSLIFEAGNFSDTEGNLIAFGPIEIISVGFIVNQVKNVIVTPVQGRNGTVKEYVSDGDFAINITGVFNGENADQYPETEVNTLINILRAPVSLKISSNFLNRFNITELVVLDYNFPQVQGDYSTQQFVINAISDRPVELKTEDDTL